MNYSGKLYGKGQGRTYFPLVLTSEDVDRMQKEHGEMKEALEYILGIGLTVKTESKALRALGRDKMEGNVTLSPDVGVDASFVPTAIAP